VSHGDAPKPGPTVVLVRHGETEWSRTGRHTGRTDVALTDLGRRQAERTGRRLSGRRFGLVLASPVSRAAETCRLAGLGAAAEATDDLLEWDYGDYEGRRTEDIRRSRPGWTLWADGVPGGETAEAVGRRADRVIGRALTVDGDVALFGHGHILRVLAARWIGQPATGGAHFALEPSTISVLGWERETRVVLGWNNGTHLYGET
jgi:broad specificity phosphatase PhoE